VCLSLHVCRACMCECVQGVYVCVCAGRVSVRVRRACKCACVQGHYSHQTLVCVCCAIQTQTRTQKHRHTQTHADTHRQTHADTRRDTHTHTETQTETHRQTHIPAIPRRQRRTRTLQGSARRLYKAALASKNRPSLSDCVCERDRPCARM